MCKLARRGREALVARQIEGWNLSDTNGKRIYAIGDIHGCLDLLDVVLERISADLATLPHPDPLIMFLGDYTDRGPDSRGVLDRLIEVGSGPVPSAFLLGNHDYGFLRYITEPLDRSTSKYHWLHGPMGGSDTLLSYGIAGASGEDPGATHAAFVMAVPQAHVDFLTAARPWIRIGGYGFAHAGIMPGKPLEEQDFNDLIWIRAPFLTSTLRHAEVIVHGHTPVDRIEHHGNRIAVDTGAVFGGRLSCLVLEGREVCELDESGRTGLTPVRGGRG